MLFFLLILIGFLAGLCGGFFGIGGGIVISPLLVYLLRFPQKLSQGTTLVVMLLPVMLPAVSAYWQSGNVDVKAACFIAIGFIVGSYSGGCIVQYLPDVILTKAFAVFLIAVAIKMLLT